MVNEFGGAYGGSAPGESASENVTGTDEEETDDEPTPRERERSTYDPSESDDEETTDDEPLTDSPVAGGGNDTPTSGRDFEQETESVDTGGGSSTSGGTSDSGGTSGGSPGGLAGVADRREESDTGGDGLTPTERERQSYSPSESDTLEGTIQEELESVASGEQSAEAAQESVAGFEETAVGTEPPGSEFPFENPQTESVREQTAAQSPFVDPEDVQVRIVEGGEHGKLVGFVPGEERIEAAAEFAQTRGSELEDDYARIEENYITPESLRVTESVLRGDGQSAATGAEQSEDTGPPDGTDMFGGFANEGPQNVDVPGENAEVDPGVLESFRDAPATEMFGDDEITPGFLNEDQEESLRAASQDYEQWADDLIGVEGSTGVGRFARSGTRALVGIGNVPGIALGLETAAETADKLPTVIDEEGAADVGETFLAGGKAVGGAAVSAFKEDPIGTTGRATGEVVGAFALGATAFKGIEKVGDARRAAKLSTRADVDFEDVTTERGAAGELPKFDTDPDAPTKEAVDELEERARDNPDVVTEQTGGEASLFHGTQSTFGRSVDVDEGASELPGIFTSPEASPIALEGIKSSLPSPTVKPRLPSLGGKSDRFLGLPGDDIRGMPSSATGSGYALRQGDDVLETGLGRGQAKAQAADMADDVEVTPDPTTRGYQFLTEEAEEGVAYVRPRGARTGELEAIYAPGSQFEKTGTIGVRVGRRQFPFTDRDIPLTGRKVPMDTFERPDADDAAGVADDAAMLESMRTGETATYRSLVDDASRLSDDGSPAAAGGYVGGGPAALPSRPAFDAGSPTRSGGETTFPTSAPIWGSGSAVFGGVGSSTPPSGTSGISSTPISAPPSSFGSSLTSSPVTSSPTSGGPSSGSPTSGGPTSGGPSGSSATPTGSEPSGSGGGPSPTPSGGNGSPTYPFGLPELGDTDEGKRTEVVEPDRGERRTGFLNPLTGTRITDNDSGGPLF